MRSKIDVAGAALALGFLVAGAPDSASAAPAACPATITRARVVPCALAASQRARSERLGRDAALGRVEAAHVVLPSNPVVSFSAGRRSSARQAALNWSASLAQEVEIGGQRGARIDAAEAQAAAQDRRARLTEREVAAEALVAYFEALAARDDARLAERLAGVADALTAASAARAGQGLLAPIEADVAHAAAVRLVRARTQAEQRVAETLAVLATALGLDPVRERVVVEGDLSPLAVVGAGNPAALADAALPRRRDVAAARADAAAERARIEVLRRERIPNPTLSVFVERDGFNELLVGGGLSLPIPLPSPLGRTNAGAIAEATALAARADTEAERLQRRARLEVLTAAQAFAARRRELEAFDETRLVRAEQSLRALGEELAAGRLAPRDALVSEQALLELLEAHLEAKRALCIASVELARVAGLPLEGVAP